MNNKGFTLIELLVTVALLSVIATISFVSINNIIKESKVNNCKSIVDSIKSATSEYVSDNRYGTLNIDGFNAKILIDNNYLKGPIYDPFTKNEINAENIKITITLNRDYTLQKATITEPNVLVTCN